MESALGLFLRRVATKLVKAVATVFSLPVPPKTIDEAVVEIEERV